MKNNLLTDFLRWTLPQVHNYNSLEYEVETLKKCVFEIRKSK